MLFKPTPPPDRPGDSKLCKLCHLAGNPATVYTSHTSAECGSLTGTEREQRQLYTSLCGIYAQAEATPNFTTKGWCKGEGEDQPCHRPHTLATQEQLGMIQPVKPSNLAGLETPSLHILQPVPSLQLLVAHEQNKFAVTLDSGAAVSFCTPALVKRLNLAIQPNSQLMLLADQRYRVQSKGEVDFLVVEQTTSNVLLRIRALVMDNLVAECYGGQTFHLDNAIAGDVSCGRIYLDGESFVVKQDTGDDGKSVPPPAQSVRERPSLLAAAATVLMKPEKYLLPAGTYHIPTESTTSP